MFYHMKRAFQVRFDDRIEIRLGHLYHQIVFRYARIVYKNINMAELCNHIFHHFSAGFKVGYRTLYRRRFSPHALDFLHNFFRLFSGTIIIYDNVRTVFRQRQRDLTPDSAACSRHESHFSCQHISLSFTSFPLFLFDTVSVAAYLH